tara:strand:+ start:3872 stop:4333 length:462 start_codon:yes stop_codon:yes gene_type:complete
MSLEKLLRPIYSVFGIGYIKIGSGTFCSLLACLIILIFGENIEFFARLIILLIILPIGFMSTNFRFEKDNAELKDPNFVVIDEFIGMWIVLLIVDNSILLISLSFLLFRFFDITKLLGIHKIEKLNGSLGIILDDVFAGLYSLIIIYIIKFIF